MSQQLAEYLRIIGLTECLLGVMLVALIYLAQKIWKRIDGMSLMMLTIVPEDKVKARLAELARQVEEAVGKRKEGGTE